MLVRTWDSGLIRARRAGSVLGVLWCLSGCTLPTGPSVAPSEGTASGGVAGGGPVVGSAGAAVGFQGGNVVCINPAPTTAPPVFAAQIVSAAEPARAELYTWLTDEEVTALRAGQPLFSSPVQPSFKGQSLQALTFSSDPATAQLATLLSGQAFANGRIAWPEPWAIRSTVTGEDHGPNPVRVVLKPEAWVAVLAKSSLSVVDQQNQPIATAAAVASPSRIGAIFYEHDQSDGGPDCALPGSGIMGYRAFVLSNLAMVSEWSLGTQQIRDRLSANISQLTELFNRTRACPNEVSAQFWNQDVVCLWDAGVFVPSEDSAYAQALAMPSEQYSLDPPKLAALIDNLQSDLFEIDPFIVTPGSP